MKKTRIFGSLMAVALMLGTTAGIPEMFTGVQDSSIMTVDAATFNVRQTNKKVNLLDKPNGSKNIITLSKDRYVSELASSKINGEWWYYVKFTTYKGWAKAKDLPIVFNTVKTTTSALNLRTGGSTNYPIITTIPKNDTVHVINYNKNKSWQKVVWNGYTGYCSSDYLR